MTVPTCPNCAGPLDFAPLRVVWCPRCRHEYVVSISDAYPAGRRNHDAPFASLVDLVIEHQRQKAAA